MAKRLAKSLLLGAVAAGAFGMLPASLRTGVRLAIADVVHPQPLAASTETPCDAATADLSRQALLARCVRLEAELSRWRPPVASLPPLVAHDLLDARVLLAGDAAELDTTLADGTRPGQWVVSPSQPHIDRGLPYRLAADDWLLDGRWLVGRITRPGRLSSAFESVRNATFRQPAELLTPDGRRVDAGQAVLVGTRVSDDPDDPDEADEADAGCELRFVSSQVPVAVGQFVVTPAATGPVLLLGRVTQATLSPSNPHWTIAVEPVPPPRVGQSLVVLSRRVRVDESTNANAGASP